MTMNAFNQAGFAAIHGLSGRNFLADIAGIFFAEWLPYFLVLGFFVVLFLQKGTRRRIYIFAEGALAVILARGIVTPVIQFFYHEIRPYEFYGISPLVTTSGWSFPSAHMTLFFALATVLWFSAKNRVKGLWYFLLPALIGVARIYAGLHWPLDIISGAVIGIASALLVRWLLAGSRKRLFVFRGGEGSPLSAVPKDTGATS